MTTETILVWLLVGAVAGWLAGALVRGGGFGLFGNIIVGIIGAAFGGWLFPHLGIAVGAGIINTVIWVRSSSSSSPGYSIAPAPNLRR